MKHGDWILVKVRGQWAWKRSLRFCAGAQHHSRGPLNRQESMLYYLLYPLHTDFIFFNVFRYITFRTIYATVTALLLTLILGPLVIARLARSTSDSISEKTGLQPTAKRKERPPPAGAAAVFHFYLNASLG